MSTVNTLDAYTDSIYSRYQTVANAVSMDPSLKGVIYSRLLDESATQHNAFEAFTSMVDAKTNLAGGVRSIFARKNDLKAGGGSQVVFNVIGSPSGPGAVGAQKLVGRTSSVALATYSATVAWHRDAIGFTKDMFEFLSAGKVLESTSLNLLGKKLGIQRQNHMMMRLIREADGNVYRPNNKTSVHDLTRDDVISLSMAVSARPRLNGMGGKPISQKVGPNGSLVNGFLIFGTDHGFLPLRNDDAFMNVLSNGRANESVVSGALFDWQGMPWYELPTVDEDWDDYLGNPLLPKAKLGVAFSVASGASDCVLRSDTAAIPNTLSPYYQFFPGSAFSFDGETATAENAEHYAWIINPTGTVGFVAYQDGFTTGNNRITVTKILCHDTGSSTGTSTKGYDKVGDISTNTTDNTWVGKESNLPGVEGDYTDSFAAGAIIIPANSYGEQIGYGFVFGAMSACFASGRIDKAAISQEEDFGFMTHKGYEAIYGTCLTTNTTKKPVGYLLLEHSVQREGYPTPEWTAPA